MVAFLRVTSKKDIKTRWEEDYHLIDGSGLFEEYLEMGRIKKKFSIHKESYFIDLIHTNTK
jgi:hypothetical protein